MAQKKHGYVYTTFTLERDTKGTHVYKEDGPDTEHKIGTLYIKKSAISGAAPTKITVTVE